MSCRAFSISPVTTSQLSIAIVGAATLFVAAAPAAAQDKQALIESALSAAPPTVNLSGRLRRRGCLDVIDHHVNHP